MSGFILWAFGVTCGWVTGLGLYFLVERKREARAAADRKRQTAEGYPDWTDSFVLLPGDRYAPCALRCYATNAEICGENPSYVEKVHRLAERFEEHQHEKEGKDDQDN